MTNKKRLNCGIRLDAANAILVKVNQIGTLTEALEAVEMAYRFGYRAIIPIVPERRRSLSQILR